VTDESDTTDARDEDEPVGTTKEQRVEGGWVQVMKTERNVWMAFFLEDPGTEPPGGMARFSEDVGAQGGEAALKWAVREWNEKRLGRLAPDDPAPPHGDPLASEEADS
jgi:hypothetical protein